MKYLTVEEYDALSPVKKHYYCKALERNKRAIPRVEAIVPDIYLYPYYNPITGLINWGSRREVEMYTALAWSHAALKDREFYKKYLEAKNGGES